MNTKQVISEELIWNERQKLHEEEKEAYNADKEKRFHEYLKKLSSNDPVCNRPIPNFKRKNSRANRKPPTSQQKQHTARLERAKRRLLTEGEKALRKTLPGYTKKETLEDTLRLAITYISILSEAVRTYDAELANEQYWKNYGLDYVYEDSKHLITQKIQSQLNHRFETEIVDKYPRRFGYGRDYDYTQSRFEYLYHDRWKSNQSQPDVDQKESNDCLDEEFDVSLLQGSL